MAQSQSKSIQKSTFPFTVEEASKFGQVQAFDSHIDHKGVTHTYFRQVLQGKAVWGSSGSTHSSGSQLHKTTSSFFPYLEQNKLSNGQSLSLSDAVKTLARFLEFKTESIGELEELENPNSYWLKINAPSIAHTPLAAESIWYLDKKSGLKHAWAIAIDAIGGDGWNLYILDAGNGSLLFSESWKVSCNHGAISEEHNHDDGNCSHDLRPKPYISEAVMFTDSFQYNIFPLPIESPYYGSRSVVESPWDSIPSPMGWHKVGGTDYAVSKGNNVDAYLDVNNSNSPTNGDADRAEGGDSLLFNFPWVNNGMHVLHQDAALVSIFYMTNTIHDILHYYGFNEASGNFQSENYTAGGAGSDYIRAEVQDGGDNCNANFWTPIDGFLPRMQTYLCNYNGRSVDLAFDNAITAHEIGHGVSNRLVGGRLNTSCLNNQEQMGEGWSDWLGYILTIEPGDTGTDARGIGTWLNGGGQSGIGIRAKKYSTDFATNNFTYNDIKTQSIPHGIGAVWATMLWDLTWGFVDLYGFDADLYDAASGGNSLAIELILEGMKLTACRPGFVDGRDAIIAADSLLHGGIHNRLIWETFARRGLGYSADQGSSNSRADGTEAFDLPPHLYLNISKAVDKLQVAKGELLTYTITINNHFDEVLNNIIVKDKLPQYTSIESINDGGVIVGDSVIWSSIDLGIGDQAILSFTVQVDQDFLTVKNDFYEDMEIANAAFAPSFSGTTNWTLGSADANSGSQSWFAPDNVGVGLANLDFAEGVGLTEDSKLTFVHRYNTEFNWDGGLVFISIDNGNSWQDLRDHFVLNGYNALINNAIRGFSGNSETFITSIVDLSAFENQEAIFRFQMNCDQFVGGEGWYIDDVTVDNLALLIPNVVSAQSGSISVFSKLPIESQVVKSDGDFFSNVEVENLICHNNMNAAISALVVGEGSPDYLWSNGATTSSISNLSTGIYSATVSESTDTFMFTRHIINPDTIISSVETVDSGAGNGLATLTVEGGVPAYTHVWTSGAEGLIAEQLLPEMYYVTTTDDYGCQVIDSALIETPSCDSVLLELVLDFDQFPQETKYLFLNNGDTIFDSGYFEDEAPFSRLIVSHCLDTECYDFIVQDEFGNGLCGLNSDPGGYILTDVNKGLVLVDGCFPTFGDTTAICINDIALNFSTTPMSCNGIQDGAATVSASGGSGNHTYAWSHGPTTPFIFSLSAGVYSVSVSDGVETVVDSIEIYPLGYPLVTSRADDGVGSLRQTIFDACPGDTIRFAQALDELTILLTSGSILIDKDIVIDGSGKNSTLISAMNVDNVFTVASPNIVSLMNMTLTNGNDSPNGGAVVNFGTLTLSDIDIKYSYENEMKIPMINMGTINVLGGTEMRY